LEIEFVLPGLAGSATDGFSQSKAGYNFFAWWRFWSARHPETVTNSPLSVTSLFGQSDTQRICLSPLGVAVEHTAIYAAHRHRLALSGDELRELLEVVRPLLEDWGRIVVGRSSFVLELNAEGAKHWQAGAWTYPSNILGKNLIDALPDASQHAIWHGRLTEVQMALFHTPFNQRRIEQGKPTVDWLWPWAPPLMDTGVPDRKAVLLHQADWYAIDVAGIENSCVDWKSLVGMLDSCSEERLRLLSLKLYDFSMEKCRDEWLRHYEDIVAMIEGVIPLMSERRAALSIYPGNGFCYTMPASRWKFATSSWGKWLPQRFNINPFS